MITINCLGMGLPDRGMGYPCLGFCRLNSMGLGGICEADLQSTMTHLIFNYLVGRPGFVNDPCFDYSNNTIPCADCVAATKMLGPDSDPPLYHPQPPPGQPHARCSRSKCPWARRFSMAKLVGNDLMLFSPARRSTAPWWTAAAAPS